MSRHIIHGILDAVLPYRFGQLRSERLLIAVTHVFNGVLEIILTCSPSVVEATPLDKVGENVNVCGFFTAILAALSLNPAREYVRVLRIMEAVVENVSLYAVFVVIKFATG